MPCFPNKFSPHMKDNGGGSGRLAPRRILPLLYFKTIASINSVNVSGFFSNPSIPSKKLEGNAISIINGASVLGQFPSEHMVSNKTFIFNSTPLNFIPGSMGPNCFNISNIGLEM